MAPDLIDQLGGNGAVAEALKAAPNAVANWRTRGIPWKRRHAIARLAADRGVSLPPDYWEAAE